MRTVRFEPKMYLRAFELYRVAVRNCTRIRNQGSEDTNRTEALIPILFSAASLEAYIMDLAAAAHGDEAQGYQVVGDVFRKIVALEEKRSATSKKFKAALRLLGSKAYDKKKSPFEDFEALFRLRNAIVHLQPYLHVGSPHELTEYLHGKGLCGSSSEDRAWISIVSTPKVGRWACDTVPNIVDEIVAHLPQPLRGRPSLCRRISEGYREFHNNIFSLADRADAG